MFSHATPRCLRCALFVLLQLACSPAATLAAASEAPRTLADALELALSRGVEPSAGATAGDPLVAGSGAWNIDRGSSGASAMGHTRAWLANPPTLAVSHLESDQRLGTDETEVSLNFPFKSPLQRRSDHSLRQLDPRLDEVTRRYRRWYLSGTLRDLFARHRQARVALNSARATTEVLARFAEQLAEGRAAGAADRYDVLAVQARRAEAEGFLERHRAEVRGTLRLYQALTGFTAFPDDAGDDTPLPEVPRYAQHPALQLLELNQARDLASLRASSPAATPWNLALVGRELEIPAFSERQLGIAIEVPLSFGNHVAPATASGERALHRDYTLQRDQRLASMRLAWERLTSERAALLARQARAAINVEGENLAVLVDATRRSLELPIEVRLQRLLTLLELQAMPAKLAEDLEANAAAMRQLAGMSL